MGQQLREVRLSGFLVSVHCPTEALLKIRIDTTHLSWEEYRALLRELQDHLAFVDEQYAKRTPKIRSILADHKRIKEVGGIRRKRELEFSPFPSRFANIIKNNVRARVYDLLARYALVIQRMARGRAERNLYLLPENLAGEFVKGIEKVNEKIDELNDMIEEYDLEPIREILRKYDLDLPKSSFYIPYVEVDLTPITIGPEVIEEWAEKSPEVANLLDAKRRELVEKVIMDVRKRLEPIIQALAGERRLLKIKERLSMLKEQVEGLGLKALADSIIVPLIKASENPEKAFEILGDRPDRFVSGRVEALLKAL